MSSTFNCLTIDWSAFETPSEKLTKSLRNGDVVRLTRTLVVTRAVDKGFYARDTQRPDWNPFWVPVRDTSAQVELVKKARRQRQQFAVGQVVTSDTLREVMWVRGTVIESVKNGAAFVLREDGKWHDLLGNGCECKAGWPFEDFAGDYRIVRLP